MSDNAPRSDNAASPTVEISGSRQFTAWLTEQNLSLAFTTYRADKLFFVGLNPDGKLSIFERTFERCMGLYASDSGLVMSSLYQLWRFENALPPDEAHEGYDRAYVPQVGYITGDLDIHDVTLDLDDRPIFVNTLFSCLATTDERHSFTPLWQPPFISKLAAEDRCHLNGLALHEGRPRFVTAMSQSDVADGWRDFRRDGGCVIDVPSSTVIAGGLSMPHSPRIYQGKLWLLDSGNGNFGFLDLDTGKFETVTFLPGYGRGLAFHGDFAVVGLSSPRGRALKGLALEENMAAYYKNVEPRCALHVIDLRSGDAVHWLRIDGIVEELYDVVTLPGVRRPMAIGFRTDEVRRVITVGDGPEQGPASALPAPAGLH